MVIWTPRARADLKAIHDHIAKDSVQTAKRVVRDIVQKPTILPEHPQLGRKVPELGDDNIREVSQHSWRIIYHWQQGHIFIVAVVHKRRRLSADEL